MASVQEDAIRKASSGFHSVSISNILGRWNEFRRHLWGKGDEAFQKVKLVKRDKSDLVNDVELPDRHLVATTFGLSDLWDLEIPQFLVRSEYTEAEQAAVSMCGEFDRDMIAITGRPGIGKSIFLLWLLMRRLSLQLPTALQIDASYAILFHKGGVSEFTDLRNDALYRHLFFPDHPSHRIWLLIDSNPKLLEPANIFKDGAPFFVVNVVSPHSRPLKWFKKIGYENFYMKSWSGSEVLQARNFFCKDITERQVWYLYNEFGAHPRALVQHSRNPVQYEHVVLGEINKLDPAHIAHAFRVPGSYGLFDYIMTMEPSPVDRNAYVTDIASRRVFKILWDKCIRPWVTNKEDLYDLFWSSAGLVFEYRMHQLLTRQQAIKLFPMRCDLGPNEANFIYETYSPSDPMSLWLPKSTEHKLFEGTRLEANVYYRPDSENFPSIHSLLLIYPPGETSPVLLMFHFALNQRYHDASLTVLHKIDSLKIPPNTRRCFVVVTTEDIGLEIKYFEGKGQRRVSPDDDFLVSQYCIHAEELLQN